MLPPEIMRGLSVTKASWVEIMTTVLRRAAVIASANSTARPMSMKDWPDLDEHSQRTCLTNGGTLALKAKCVTKLFGGLRAQCV